MSDRQNPNDPSYDWLYSGERETPRQQPSPGDDTQYYRPDDMAPPPQRGPGETQMMPPVQGSGQQPGGQPAQPQQPPQRDSFGGTYPAPERTGPPPADDRFAPPADRRPAGPPPGGPGGPTGPGGPYGPSGQPGKPRRRSRRRWWIRGILALVLLYLVFLIVTPVIALNKIDRVNAEPSGKRPDDTPGTTYLLVGNSARKSAQSNLADSILILHVTDGSGPNLLVSIPRDSEVDIPGYGTNKINAATSLPQKRAAGRKLLVQTVEQNTGVRIDDYIEVGFGTFPKLVDAVGGVELCLKKKQLVSSARAELKDKGYVTDELAHLKMEAGCQEMDGDGAFAFSRARHIFAYGDYARGQHQREVISAVGHKIMSPWTFVLPWRYWNINMESAKVLRVGDNVGTWDLVKFARAITSGPKSCIMPMVSLADNSWDSSKVDTLMGHIRDDDTSDVKCSVV